MRNPNFKSLLTLVLSIQAHQISASTCKELPNHAAVSKALEEIVKMDNGGIFSPNAMWASLVNRDGTVCVVAKSGDAWPGSRVISAQKASTANAFSNQMLSLSTANLFSAVQPGGSLFGLQESNPVDTNVAYQGISAAWGTAKDHLIGKRIGGVNVFGGGVALYATAQKNVLGGLGVSGDSSCADHIIAWRLRAALQLDRIPGGISPQKDDNMVLDIDANGKSAGGFGHPTCSPKAADISNGLRLSKK
jgi:uncharacterized protein GlcG (DUF336 family)